MLFPSVRSLRSYKQQFSNEKVKEIEDDLLDMWKSEIEDSRDILEVIASSTRKEELLLKAVEDFQNYSLPRMQFNKVIPVVYFLIKVGFYFLELTSKDKHKENFITTLE